MAFGWFRDSLTDSFSLCVQQCRTIGGAPVLACTLPFAMQQPTHTPSRFLLLVPFAHGRRLALQIRGGAFVQDLEGAPAGAEGGEGSRGIALLRMRTASSRGGPARVTRSQSCASQSPHPPKNVECSLRLFFRSYVESSCGRHELTLNERKR